MGDVRTNWQSGQPIPAKDIRGNSEALAGLVQSARDATSAGAGFKGNDARYVVKITAVTQVDSVFEYEFEQVEWDTATSDWTTATAAITHESIGKATAQGGIDYPQAAIDDIVTIRPGSRVDGSGRRQWEFVAGGGGWFYAKVTTSSGSAAHTITELDASGAVLTGGRVITDAEAMNGRAGVPVDTLVIAFDLGPTTSGGAPVHKFIITDGLTTSPKNLIGSGASADTTTWDIEVDSQPVLYLPFRVFDDTANSGNWYSFRRQVTTDASGMVVFVSGETRAVLSGDGYNETRHNNTSVDIIPSGGVLDFDDGQTPGTDELVVEWTLTGAQDAEAGGDNDGLRTQIRGKVDVSGITGGGGEADELAYNNQIKVDATTTIGTEVTLDSEDYRGRNIRIVLNFFEGTQAASTTGNWTGNGIRSARVAESATGEIEIDRTGNLRVFVDGDDGGKLKAANLSSSVNDYHHHLTVVASEVKNPGVAGAITIT